jgi:DNA ligase (NAD+)
VAVRKSKRVAELESLVRKHQDLYYNGQAQIEDGEFDALWDELSSLDPGNPVLQAVGADSSDGYAKVEHLIPMGSQEKASDPESFLKWAAKVKHPEYLVQYKLDGASLELQYSAGEFLRAVTRGDGMIGDDISANVRRMRGFVPRLKEDFSGGVRGEVVMSHAAHDQYFPDKANCRNAANGIMKRKDGEGSQRLDILCYDAQSTENPGFFERERDKLAWLSAQGFATVEQRILPSPEEVVDYRAHVMDIRTGLPFDIDGLVVKGDRIDVEDSRRSRPEKQIAFKFSLEEAISTLVEVEWSESGAIYTPIGIISPVQLAGTTVKRANLCNPDMLRSLGLKLGSRIVITKRGEIIPKIEGLVENPADVREIPYPTACSCGSLLVDEGTRLACPNPQCPKKALHRLRKWLDVLDVKDFGDVLLGKLFDSGRVRAIADLYGLSAQELASLERMGETSAAKILKHLKGKSSVSLPAFLAGLDIEGIGELIAGRFVQAGFDTLDSLRKATAQELSGVFGVGDITAKAFVQGLASLSADIDALIESGAIHLLRPVSGGTLAGKSFCFTGELRSMKRPEAESRIKALGGSAKSQVVKDLSYLVTNDPGSGSSKNAKARELGIPILDEEAFLELIREGT